MRRKRGQATLEIALALPIMVMVFCGIVDFGRIFHASSHLNIVSQEAARLAGLGKSDTEVVNYVKEKTNLKDKAAVKVSINPVQSARRSGDYVTLGIAYEIKYITPLIGKLLPSPFKINVKSTIRVE
jgi:Flp pilus assembly protein TadG